jgi:hypothetical protein
VTIALERPLVRGVTLTTVGLAAALVLPLAVHLIPAADGPPYGARLLPIFFASLVLVVRGAPVPAIAVALLAPVLNRAVTGMPAGPMLPTLLVELTLFTLLLVLAVRASPRFARYLGPVAYLVAAVLARPLVGAELAVFETLRTALVVAWPGLLLLLVVGAIAGTGPGERSGMRAARGTTS